MSATPASLQIPESLLRAVKRTRSASRDLNRELAKYADTLAAAGIELDIQDDHSPKGTGDKHEY